MFHHRLSYALLVALWLDQGSLMPWSVVSAAEGFQSSLVDTHINSNNLLPPSISEVPFSKFEMAEHARAFQEIRDSCQGCWSGSISVLGMQEKNQVVIKKPPVRNFRLQVDLKGNTGTWKVWNLMQEGDETIVPLRWTPVERPSQYKVAFPGIILRIPCAITAALPRIVFEIGYWDQHTRRTSVAEYCKEKSWLSGTQVPWRLDETSLVQMKRQPSAGFVGRMTDPRAIAFLPTKAPFSLRDWDWTLWEPTQTERVDFMTGERTHCRIDGDNLQQDLYSRIVQAFDETDPSTFVHVLPNSMLTSLPYRLNPSPDDTLRAVFAHAWDDNQLAIVEIEYQGRLARTACLHCFRKK